MVTEPKSYFRAHSRRRVRLDATLRHPGAGWEQRAEVLDMGLGGACIGLTAALTPGERVSIAFLAPTLWDPLALPARVAWFREGEDQGPARAGLAFEYESPTAARALFELVGTLSF